MLLKTSENVKSWIEQEKKVAEEFDIYDQALWDRLDFYSPQFKSTFRQAEQDLAWLCLLFDSDKKNERALISRLISVSTLLFVCRDHLVFQLAYDSGLYDRIVAKKPLHRLPTVVQVKAIIKALRPEWTELTEKEGQALDSIENLTTEVLKIEKLKVFRDQALSTGVLLHQKENKSAKLPDKSIFPAEEFNISALVQEAGHCWAVLSSTLANQ